MFWYIGKPCSALVHAGGNVIQFILVAIYNIIFASLEKVNIFMNSLFINIQTVEK